MRFHLLCRHLGSCWYVTPPHDLLKDDLLTTLVEVYPSLSMCTSSCTETNVCPPGQCTTWSVLLADVSSMVQGGYETTASALSFTIYNLAANPDKAAKLMQVCPRNFGAQSHNNPC